MGMETTKLLDDVDVTSTGAGAWYQIPETVKAFHCIMVNDDCTIKLQGSNADSPSSADTYNFDLRTSTASEAYSTAEPWKWIRGNVTATGTGTASLICVTSSQ